MTTILVADTDDATLRHTRAVLEHAGFRVRAHADAAGALEDAAALEPDAVVSAVAMPGVDGLTLVEAYLRRFPGRGTPILLLSASSSPADVARCLDGGASDCLATPVAPAVLAATLRARLRNATALRGDLSELPFGKLMQLCEATGLSGELVVDRDGGSARVEFVAGVVAQGKRALAADLLGRRQGAFVLRARPVDVRQLATTPIEVPAATPSPHHPAGRLSGVRIGDRVFQVQTEYTRFPEPQIVTVVMLGGRTLHKRSRPAPRAAAQEELHRLVATQHTESEEEVRAKVHARGAKPQEAVRARFDRLHDEGLNRFLEGDFAAAVQAWEEAHRVDPHNQTLSVNLAVARRKRDMAAAREHPGSR
jgi:CheY-like chemotaxis protein